MQKSSSSDPPTTGSGGDPGGYRRQIACQRQARAGTTEVVRQRRPGRTGGEALPFHLARENRIRFRCAEACGPWLYIRGVNRNDPGSPRLSAARYPGRTAGPVLQHRPSETLPRLKSEREGLAM